MNDPYETESVEQVLHRLRSLPLRPPADDLRRRLFGATGRATVSSTTAGAGVAAWLMPVGAALVALLGWVGTPGSPLQAMAGDTNAAWRVAVPGLAAVGVNSIPARRLTSTLSNVAPSTNVLVRGWD